MGNLLIKRIYEPVDKADGVRILVDRLWPRGLKKEQAAIDQWMKDVAPSTTLRKWFNHDPQKWPMFQQEYISELTYRKSVKELIQCIQNNETVTLLYATSSHEYNHARVLQQFLLSVLKSDNGSGIPEE
ncbi:DUF488 domain-containing protein [Mucilaginibacter sp. SP1R1]|uniref:DUF488 domain-containing protein n=1 Tax=Mucilaginibacter sp. SP1R1 TaxID=2723091 RepID=UPI0016071E64|nr:DUF488 family protein [Mucilaginibacter sp. SP1R1]MBB6147630.1 uncharacterized protein YeaO (DUF488 family) [Mucilaginibacter sp. SP1R1]